MILAVLGSLGGVTAFTGAAWVIVRAVVRQSEAVRDNTTALKANTAAIEKLDQRVDEHDIRLARIETWRRR